MKYVADLHLHSRYSRACSRDLELPNIQAACLQKGIDIIGSADFTHPAWFGNLHNQLAEDGSSGLYYLKAAPTKVRWLLSTELSLVYKDKGKTRRIHLVVHAPNLQAVKELNDFLDGKYNIRSDGRPILGIKAPDLVKLCLSINPRFLIYPAHIWTPWFSVFGSKSGFDTLEECFDEQTENIYAFETGLSSDPAMNWRVSQLDKLLMLSNSDAHSCHNLAREANILDLDELSYDRFYNLLKNNQKSLVKTIEFYPEEGMYHWDGHRACNFSCPPEQSKKLKNICPVCGKPLIIGVENRVEELADREIGFKPVGASDYVKLVELDKIIADSLDIKTRSSTKVQAFYNKLINELGSELKILLEIDIKEIERVAGGQIALGVARVRRGELEVVPGFDGQYGVVKIFTQKEREARQRKLF